MMCKCKHPEADHRNITRICAFSVFCKCDGWALAESSLSSPPPRFHGHWFCPKCKQKTVNIYFDSETYRNHFRCENCDWHGDTPTAVVPNFRQSSSLTESGAESVHSGKQNTADKSELLPTQLPKEKE